MLFVEVLFYFKRQGFKQLLVRVAIKETYSYGRFGWLILLLRANRLEVF